MRDSKARQIRTLLFVFGSGIGFGLLVALVMLYYYNPAGNYIAGNVLLAPENATSMRFSEGNSRDKNNYILDDIEFIFYDSSIKQNKKMHVDMDKYAQFYALISSDTSVLDVDNEVHKQFQQRLPATILLKVKREGIEASTTPFITLDFSEDGNYYRVQLREQGATDAWAYFYHEDIYKKVLKLFTAYQVPEVSLSPQRPRPLISESN